MDGQASSGYYTSVPPPEIPSDQEVRVLRARVQLLELQVQRLIEQVSEHLGNSTDDWSV